MIPLYQQRDFGEKINATFTYATQQIRSLGLALLYIAGPPTLIAGIVGGVYQSNILKTVGTFGGGQLNVVDPFKFLDQVFSPAYWLLIVFSVISYVCVSLTVYSHMRLYARNQGAPITVDAVWRDVQAMLVGGIGVSLVLGAAIVAGMILFIIPGIYLSIPLSLGLAVFAFEGKPTGEIFTRCFTLIRDKWWSTFGLIIVMSIIVGVVSLVFSIPATIVTVMGIVGKENSNSLVIILTQALAILGARLLSALVVLALGFQYFNLVERQEGTGLLSAINSIGTPPSQPRSQDEGTY